MVKTFHNFHFAITADYDCCCVQISTATSHVIWDAYMFYIAELSVEGGVIWRTPIANCVMMPKFLTNSVCHTIK